MEFDMTDLPDSWQKRRIRDVGAVVTGRTPSTKREDFYGGDYNLISPADLDNGKYVITAHKRLTNTGFMQCRALPKDTVLVGCIGNVGKLGMVADKQSATNQQINAVICNQENNPHFIYYSFHSNRSRLEQAADKTTLPILNKTNFENFEIAVPPLAEQHKIASVLGLVQRAIEQQERLIALTTELKKALLQQLFTQGLRGEPQKQTEIGLVPESWEVVTLSDVAKLQSGGTPARDKPEYWTAGDIPWVKTGEIDYHVIRTTEERITREGLANSAAKVFPKGTLLIAMYGQGVTRGRVGVLGIDAATNQACAAITPRDEQRVSTQFIYHYLEFHYEDLRQMGHGANQRNLNAALIKGFRLSFPKPDEQAQIVEALGVLNAKLTLHQSKHTALTTLFRALLHQLMTAQIRVNGLALPDMEANP